MPRPSRSGNLLTRNYEPITIVRAGPTGDLRIQVQGLMQTDKAIFPIDTDVTEGDVIEKRLPTVHPAVSAAAGALFVDGHYSRAVFAAFQAVEHAVQQQTGLATSGVPLMHHAFSPKSPKINVARRTGRAADDEQEGFQFLFAGAMQGLRNPRGHRQDPPDNEEEALEYLALASLLMRRI